MANSESGCALTSSTRFGLIIDFSSYVACTHMHMDVQRVLFDCAHIFLCGVCTHECPTCVI